MRDKPFDVRDGACKSVGCVAPYGVVEGAGIADDRSGEER